MSIYNSLAAHTDSAWATPLWIARHNRASHAWPWNRIEPLSHVRLEIRGLFIIIMWYRTNAEQFLRVNLLLNSPQTFLVCQDCVFQCKIPQIDSGRLESLPSPRSPFQGRVDSLTRPVDYGTKWELEYKKSRLISSSCSFVQIFLSHKLCKAPNVNTSSISKNDKSSCSFKHLYGDWLLFTELFAPHDLPIQASK